MRDDGDDRTSEELRKIWTYATSQGKLNCDSIQAVKSNNWEEAFDNFKNRRNICATLL